MRNWSDERVYERHAPKMVEVMLSSMSKEYLYGLAEQSDLSEADRKLYVLLVENNFSTQALSARLSADDFRHLFSGAVPRLMRFVAAKMIEFSEQLDVTPTFAEDGSPIETYPFIKITHDYLFNDGKYRLLITRCDKSQFWDKRLTNEELAMFNKVHVFKWRKKQWLPVNDRYARDRIKTHQMLGDLNDEES
jgi:hypothetical protein